MKSLLFTFLSMTLLSISAAACDKCKKDHQVFYAPSYAYSYAPASAFVPTTVASVPMYYQAAPATVVSSASISPQFVVSSTQTSTAPASIYVLQSTPGSSNDLVTQQGLEDILFGIGRPIACEACRQFCGTSGGGGSTGNPLGELRETIKGIGELIRSIKDLEKDLKDAVGAETPEANEQIAELTKLRDEIRAINRSSSGTQIASDSN